MEGVQLVLRKHGLQQRRLQFQAPRRRCQEGDANRALRLVSGMRWRVRWMKGRRRQLGGAGVCDRVSVWICYKSRLTPPASGPLVVDCAVWTHI